MGWGVHDYPEPSLEWELTHYAADDYEGENDYDADRCVVEDDSVSGESDCGVE